MLPCELSQVAVVMSKDVPNRPRGVRMDHKRRRERLAARSYSGRPGTHRASIIQQTAALVRQGMVQHNKRQEDVSNAYHGSVHQLSAAPIL